MMKKNHVFNDLSSYIDNQLSHEEKQRVEEHLKECRTCTQEFSRLKALSEKLKDWQAPDLGPFFEQEVLERISAQGQERGEVKMKKKTLAILIPSGVLAGVLVFVLGFHMYANYGLQSSLKGNVVYRDAEKSKRIGEKHTGTEFGSGWDRNKEMDYSQSFTTSSYSAVPRMRYYSKQGVGDRVGYQEYEAEGRASVESIAPTKIAQSPAEGYNGQVEGSVIVIQPVLPATGQGDYIIRTAQVSLEVEDGQDAYKAVSEICRELGGYLAGSRFHKDTQGRQSGTITMRIPKDKFLAALDKLNTLGKTENVYTSSQDISQEYANLKARLDAAMVVYNKMIEALQKRQATIPDAIRMESELGPVLQRIEDLKNKIEYFNNAIAFTTITVQFREPQVSAKVLKESKKYIEESVLTAKINAVKFFAKAVPAAIVVLFLVTVLLGVIAAVKSLLSRIFKRE